MFSLNKLLWANTLIINIKFRRFMLYFDFYYFATFDNFNYF